MKSRMEKRENRKCSDHSDNDRNSDVQGAYVVLSDVEFDAADLPDTGSAKSGGHLSDMQLLTEREGNTQQAKSSFGKISKNKHKVDSDYLQNSRKHGVDAERNAESLNIVNQFEEKGASGGSYPNDIPMPGSDSLSGKPNISSRNSVVNRSRKPSVRFSDEVLVETFSNVDSETGEDTASIIVYGDGPVSSVDPDSSSVDPEEITASVQSLGSERIISNTSPERAVPSILGSSPTRVSTTASSEKAAIRRKDSIGTNLSPTDLLRRKQKQVADKIMKSVSAKPSRSGEFKKTKPVSHKLDYKDVPLDNRKMSVSAQKGSQEELIGNRDVSILPKAENTKSDEYAMPASHNVKKCSNLDQKDIDASPEVKEGLKEDGSDEQRVAVQTSSKKHKKLVDRQNSRQDLLIKRLSMNEDAESMSEDWRTESRKGGQIKELQGTNREETEVNDFGSESFSFSSPLKVLQKLDDREKNEHFLPGIASFSYCSPSKLLQKSNDRQRNEHNGPGYGAFSYTSPSELLFKMDGAVKSEQKEDFACETMGGSESGLVNADGCIMTAGTTRAGKMNNSDMEQDAEPPGAWFFESRKSNQFERGTFDFQRGGTKGEVQLNENIKQDINRAHNVNSKIEDTSDLANNISEEQFNSQNAAVHVQDVSDGDDSTDDEIDFNDVPSVLNYMNTLLTDFLGMLNDKRRNCEQITTEDYRELSVIESTIERIVNKVINSIGYLEANSVHEVGLEDTSAEKIRLARNLRAHLALLASAKQGMRANLPVKSAETVREKQVKVGSSRSLDNRCQRNAVYTDETKENKQRQASMDEVFWAIDENSEVNEMSPAEKSYKVGPARRSLSGYLGDVSTESIDERKTSVYGWSTIDDFLRETSSTNFSRYDSEMFGSEIAPSPSVSLDDDLCSVESVPETGLESAKDKHTAQCDCFECRKQWFYWIERLDMDTDASCDDLNIRNSIDRTSSQRIDSSFVNSKLKGNPYPSCMSLTTNPSFANISDEEADFENEGNIDDDSVEGLAYSSQHQDVDSLAVSDPSAHSNVSMEEYSQKQINLLTSLTFPEDTSSVRVDLGPSRFMLTKDDDLVQQCEDLEVQTTPACDIEKLTFQRGETGLAKRKQAGRSMTPDSKYMLDKEVVETQNRKLQTEISTLQTENKLLKEKYNRSQSRITELEEQLSEAQEDICTLQENLNHEVSSLSARTQHEIDRGRDNLQARIVALTKENEALKSEVSGLEKQLESSNRTVDLVRHNSEKTRTLEAHKSEISSLKEELSRVKALLEQSERHLREEEERHGAIGKQVVKLTELKNALQQQQDSGSGGTVGDKQLKSLEKRLKVTEERLHQERADRANNLSAVEDKLLTENARLQAVEKDFTRQLHREKEKNRNLDHRVKQLREENEKLRVALPFDDTKLLEDKKNYDIPYSSHSNQRAETMKHISDDMNYILSQIEKQDGLQGRSDHEEMIRTLWNKRERAYQQLREYEVNFEELHLNDNNIVDGLKNLRDTYGQAESKLRGMEEQVADAQAQMVTLETTYKEQLNILVHERHDALARLKTAEDILEAVRAENELLRQNVQVIQSSDGGKLQNGVSGSFESVQMEIANLESKAAQLTRTNQKLEGELSTAKTQVDARNKTLQDVQSELDLAYNRLKGQGGDDRKQQKIDKLSAEVSGLQVELKMLTDKYNRTVSEKSRLETDIVEVKKLADVQKVRQQKTGQTEGKVQQQLKDEVTEMESRLTSLVKQLDDTENELQKHQQDLYIEQMHNSELESEVETLRQTVDQRAQMFEALSGTEREQLAQYQILKETLDSMNQELAQKHAQIISLDVNLSSQKDRTAELEAVVGRLRMEKGAKDEDFAEDEQNFTDQLRISALEKERSQLKQELVQAYNAIKAAEEQYRTLQTESAQLEQELVKEKTVILQITAEKGEVEQHLEELAEEHDSLIQEKNQAEGDLIRLETKLQEILQKYETEARKQHSDFTKGYPNLPPEARKLVSELDSLRLLVDGKDREIGMLQDKINRQQIDIEFLNRKVELVHNDSISNREDVARMISELTLKMKEAVSTREVNQFLVAERTKLQNQKSHLEIELEQERQNNDQSKKEISNVLRKVQGTETRQKSAEKDSRDKADLITTLEADLRNTKQNFLSVESEMSQMKSQLGQQNDDLRSLTETKATIEKQLEMEKTSLLEERSALSKLREEFTRLSHDHELLQHEHAVLCDKHEADVQTIENLRRDLSTREGENSSLQEELHSTRLDLESQKGQLLITKDTVQKLTQDKGSVYQDYEGMCRTVTEKERQLTELRERSDEKLSHVKKLHLQEKEHLEQHKLSAEQERDTYKRELDSVREQLEQKEIQLNTFGRTLQELESVTRQKSQLEAQLHQLDSSSGDSKVLLEGQRKELMALNEALAKQQDRSTRIEAENHTLKADLKSQKEALNRECQELSLTVKELRSQHENERQYLNDNLAKTQTHLRSVEASLVSASNERDTLQAQKRMVEKTVEELQSQLSDESMGRRLAEQSVGTLRLQLEDMRIEKNTSEARYVEMKNQLTKVEEQLKSERTKQQKLSGRVQELAAVSHNTESTAKAKAEQIETLQKEISKLKQMIESQKQNMTGKMKKASLEFKQQFDLVQEDRDKQVLQVQKMSTDLEACREQLALKNKDILKLQEDNLVLEDSARERMTKQKHAEETLRAETEKLSGMANRFLEQDEELKRLRNFLAKKAEDSGEADKSMWQEMNRVIQDLSRQMQDHLDAQRSEGKDGTSHHQVVLRYKKQLSEVQGELGTEKSLHQITKTSLQALEEDCQRLRHQLHAMRRREPVSSEKKYKNRMEAINAIIARSQTQAQALLASGGYFDTLNSPRVPNSARPGYGSPQRPESPDNSYSEDLSIASLPPLHYGSTMKK